MNNAAEDRFVYDFPLCGLMGEKGAKAFLLEAGSMQATPIFTDRDLLETFCQRFPMPPGTWMTTCENKKSLRSHVYASVSGPSGWVIVDPTVMPDGTVTGTWIQAGRFVERDGDA